MDRDPRFSPDTTAQQWTASDPTIWADYFNLGNGVESNTGILGSRPNRPADKAIIAPIELIMVILRPRH